MHSSVFSPASASPPASAAGRRLAPGAAAGLLAAFGVGALSLAAFFMVADPGELPGGDANLHAGLQVAPDFSLRSSDAGRVTLGQFRGQTVVLVLADADLDAWLDRTLARAADAEFEPVFVGVRCGVASPAGLARPDAVLLDDPSASVARRFGLAGEVGERAGERGGERIVGLPAVVVVSADGRVLDAGPAADVLDRLDQSLPRS